MDFCKEKEWKENSIMRTQLSRLFMAVVAILAISLPVNAAIVSPNGGFEDANLNGWTTITTGGSFPTASTIEFTFSGSLTPTEGNWHGRLDAGSANAYQSMGRSLGSLAVGTNISIDTAYECQESSATIFVDDGFCELIRPSGNDVFFSESCTTVGAFGDTGWVTTPLSATEAGDHEIWCRTRNTLDGAVDSIILMDALDVTVQGGGDCAAIEAKLDAFIPNVNGALDDLADQLTQHDIDIKAELAIINGKLDDLSLQLEASVCAILQQVLTPSGQRCVEDVAMLHECAMQWNSVTTGGPRPDPTVCE